MQHSDIEERCRAYIEDWEKTAPRYALLITGAWGCGKTFLVKKMVDDRNGEAGARIAWYISLFGVRKPEDIDDKLFEAAHPILGDPKKRKWYSVGYNVLKSAAKHKYGIEIQDVTGPVLDLFKEKDDNPSGCQVLFVDDVERASMDIKDIFGYFSPIIEGDTRVIFAANERELKSGKSENDAYVRIKEKIIGETYEVEPNYDEALESFWDELMMDPFSPSEGRKQKLLDIVKTLGIQNLRIARQIIHQWGLFFRQLPEAYQEDDEFIGNLFEEYVVLAIWSKNAEPSGMGSQAMHENAVLGHDEAVRHMKSFWDKYKEKKRNGDKAAMSGADIKETLATGTAPLRYAELWPYILMKGKDADAAWLKEKMENSYQEHQELLRLRKRANRAIEQLRTATFYQAKESGQDIKKLFETVLREFDDGQYARFDDIIQYVQTYLTLMHGKVLPTDYGYEFLANQLHMFLEHHRDKISALPEFERVTKEQVMRVENQEVQKELDEIFDVAKEMTGSSEKQILRNKEKFIAYISSPDRAVTDWVNIPFLCQLDIDEVFEWMGDDLTAHRNFLKFLEYRYRKGFGNAELHRSDYPDLSQVERIHERYETLCRELEHSFRLDVRDYDELKDRYGDLIEYMNDIMRKNM